jgi:hypothetical protein
MKPPAVVLASAAALVVASALVWAFLGDATDRSSETFSGVVALQRARAALEAADHNHDGYLAPKQCLEAAEYFELALADPTLPTEDREAAAAGLAEALFFTDLERCSKVVCEALKSGLFPPIAVTRWTTRIAFKGNPDAAQRVLDCGRSLRLIPPEHAEGLERMIR